MDAKTRAIFRKAMREIGRKGGKIGGKRSRMGEKGVRSVGDKNALVCPAWSPI
jgi:hypothetical protein